MEWKSMNVTSKTKIQTCDGCQAMTGCRIERHFIPKFR
jgi:hypothetical protein